MILAGLLLGCAASLSSACVYDDCGACEDPEAVSLGTFGVTEQFDDGTFPDLREASVEVADATITISYDGNVVVLRRTDGGAGGAGGGTPD